MTNKTLTVVTGAAVLLLAFPLAGDAGVLWTSNVGLGIPPAGVPVLDFDNPNPPGVSVTFNGTDAGVFQGSTATHAAPFGDNTNYGSSGVGTLTLDYASPQQSLFFDWSTVDAYNTISFYSGTTLLGSITGDQIAPGNNGDRGPNGSYNVLASTDQPFTSAVLGSTSLAFEGDNFAAQQAASVVEPSSLAMLMVGALGMITLGMRRKQKVTIASVSG